jgi:hypothetical protein
LVNQQIAAYLTWEGFAAGQVGSGKTGMHGIDSDSIRFILSAVTIDISNIIPKKSDSRNILLHDQSKSTGHIGPACRKIGRIP